MLVRHEAKVFLSEVAESDIFKNSLHTVRVTIGISYNWNRHVLVEAQHLRFEQRPPGLTGQAHAGPVGPCVATQFMLEKDKVKTQFYAPGSKIHESHIRRPLHGRRSIFSCPFL